EYGAEVEGDGELSFVVPLDQVDDILKSIVVYDDAGGVGQASLPSREPLAQVFRDLPFGPEALDSPAALLNRLQGAALRASGARRIEGRILRAVAETVTLPDGQGTTQRHRVTLITAAGLQQFILEEADQVEFADPALAAQVEAALAAITAHRQRNTRQITIVARGQGKRRVKVGYVTAQPLWKTSYRLTLPQAGASGPALLQGWAHVDNLSGQDWKAVELTLVSGNPVTFRQALYTAYFVDRPEVPVEVLGRVLPKLDQGAIAGERLASREEFRKRADTGLERDEMLAEAPMAQLKTMAEAAEPGMAVMGAAAPLATEPMAEPEPSDSRAFLAAAAEEAATQVVFRVPQPVTVAKGQALMVPIADREAPADRLALYQPATHALHPLASLKLVNDGETGLPPGILTLYETAGAGTAGYIGDARLSVLPAGEERLISYALDQKMRVDREDEQSQSIAKGRINRGVLELTFLDRRSTKYRVKAPARETRRLVIEHPRLPGWELKTPKENEVELTDQEYRIAGDLAAGSEAVIEVVLERPRFQTIQLIGLSTAQLVHYAQTGELDEPLRKAIAELAELRRAIDEQRRGLEQLGGQRDRIFDEQKRIRDNLGRVPSNSDLQRRYLKKLDQQENRLERLEIETAEAQEALNQAEDRLSERIAQLKI
ncbi:MAG: DUF4139 domain-containing protein, partial [Rhodospirillales bacterium]|nr:DUF4139 domain-containing protein [Rhodospirillales bacterium]